MNTPPTTKHDFTPSLHSHNHTQTCYNMQMNRNVSSRYSAAAAVGMLLLSGNAVFGFQAATVASGVRSPQQKMTLAVSTLSPDCGNIRSDLDNERSFSSISNTAQGHQFKQWHLKEDQVTAESQGHLSPSLDLPNRHSVSTPEPAVMSWLEVNVGRASTVAAFFLLANELVTGQSLPSQITALAANFFVLRH